MCVLDSLSRRTPIHGVRENSMHNLGEVVERRGREEGRKEGDAERGWVETDWSLASRRWASPPPP